MATRPPRKRIQTVERLRRRLLASRGDWLAISLAADVNYKTLWRFANGKTTRPWGPFLASLDEYFERVDAGKKKPYRGGELRA